MKKWHPRRVQREFDWDWEGCLEVRCCDCCPAQLAARAACQPCPLHQQSRRSPAPGHTAHAPVLHRPPPRYPTPCYTTCLLAAVAHPTLPPPLLPPPLQLNPHLYFRKWCYVEEIIYIPCDRKHKVRGTCSRWWGVTVHCPW